MKYVIVEKEEMALGFEEEMVVVGLRRRRRWCGGRGDGGGGGGKPLSLLSNRHQFESHKRRYVSKFFHHSRGDQVVICRELV